MPSTPRAGRQSPVTANGGDEWRGLTKVREVESEQRPTTTACPPGEGAGRAGARRRYRPLELYECVLELHEEEGLSYSQIIEKIREEFGETLVKSHVSSWFGALGNRPGRSGTS